MREKLNKEWAEAKNSLTAHSALNVWGKSGIELAEANMAYQEAQERFRIIDEKVKGFVKQPKD